MIVNVAPLLKQPVGTEAEFRIAEDPIDTHGDNAGLLDADAVSIDASIVATHTNPGVYVEGDAAASIETQCSRCLRPTRTIVETTFAEQYYATVGVVNGDDLPDAPEDAKTIGSDFRMDLTPLLREELILATPQAVPHSPDCKGLCPVCGEDLNEHPHVHDDATDERWAPLSRLRDFHADRE